MAKIVQIEMYETTDGKRFADEDAAEQHEERILIEALIAHTIFVASNKEEVLEFIIKNRRDIYRILNKRGV